MSVTSALLDFAHAPHRLPETVHADALRLLGDTLAVGAAGTTAPGAAGVLAVAESWGRGGEARALGDGRRLPAASAAFVNAFRIHCLEWDAVHEGAVVHALSTVTAALGAAIDRRGGCDPEAALAALAVGVDVASVLGLGATSPLRFFRPATAGCLGSALAVARIEGLPRAAFDEVLGLAYSQCAGTMQAHVEGSIALPIQIAGAARAAIVAVDLAKAGLTGPHDAIEGPFGYYRLFDEGGLHDHAAALGRVWRIAEISTKPYPSGRASHGALGLLDALRRDGLRAQDVARIELFAPPLIARLVGRPAHAGMMPAYARLCLPLLAALMLVDGGIDPRRFTAKAFAEPAVRAVADRVAVTDDGNPDPNAMSPQRLVVTRADGEVLDRRIAATLGSPEAPMPPEAADAKRGLARALAPPGLDPRLFDDPLAYLTQPEPA